MSAETDFEDTVKICEFYTEIDCPLEVDYERRRVILGDYIVEPLVEDGRLTEYSVSRSDGSSFLVWDLDSFFQREFNWEEFV